MRIIRRIVKLLIPRIQNFSELEYRKTRVRKFSKRSVLNIYHSDDEIEIVTNKQREEIFPCFQQSLRGDEKSILDFGCGWGRFTQDLAAMIGGKAIGVDPISALIKMAPQHKNVEYKIMKDGIIPLPDKSVDIVWICLVLGGIINQSVLNRTVDEINRVLKSNGLLFLIENTAEKQNSEHWTYKSFGEYKEMFSYLSLVHLKDYFDLGERISIMTGRKLIID